MFYLNSRCVTFSYQINSNHIRHYTKVSRLYRPLNILPISSKPPVTAIKSRDGKDPISKSQRLMLDNGIIHLSSTTGTYHLLPAAIKSLEKLIRIIDRFMNKNDCQKIKMPLLSSSNIWNVTGRLKNFGSELMKVTDRHSHELLLCPTHEEVICDLMANQSVSHRSLPLRMYQIAEKFRDEKRPRFGLLRGREFIMKDLYTFDADEESALRTYEEINNMYSEMLNFIGVKWVKAQGTSGLMGGNLSHEFHLVSDVGEDSIVICNHCQLASNQEYLNVQKIRTSAGGVVEYSPDSLLCSNCGSRNITKSNAIEVGHSFFLGTKYSKPFHTTFTSDAGKLELLQMGCYGLGVSRLLSSVVEVLSTQDEIRWPLPLAPYLIAVIPPKEGSIEESVEPEFREKLTKYIDELLPQDVIVDDRTDLTIGRRIKDIKKLGIPYIIVFGKQMKDSIPKVELVEVSTGNIGLYGKEEIFTYLYDLKSQWEFL